MKVVSRVAATHAEGFSQIFNLSPHRVNVEQSCSSSSSGDKCGLAIRIRGGPSELQYVLLNADVPVFEVRCLQGE